MSSSDNFPIPSDSNNGLSHTEIMLKGFFKSLKKALEENTRAFQQNPDSTTPIIPLNAYFCKNISEGIHMENHPQNKIWCSKLKNELSVLELTSRTPLHLCDFEVREIFKHSVDDSWHSVPENHGEDHVQIGLSYKLAEDLIICNDTENAAITNELLRIEQKFIETLKNADTPPGVVVEKIKKPAILTEIWNMPASVNSQRFAFYNPTWSLMKKRFGKIYRMYIEIVYGYQSPEGQVYPAIIGDKTTNPDIYQPYGYYIVGTTGKYLGDTTLYTPPPPS